MNRQFFFRILLLLVVVAAGLNSQADESLGRLELSGLLLEPSYGHVEPHTGSFSAGRSYAELRWTLDPMVSATLKFGSRELLGQPARFGVVTNPESLAVIEAYGQTEAALGRLRFGMIPIVFGLEGGDSEKTLLLPRSLIFINRYLVLRDAGASYHISSAGFFSDWAIHNGEGGTDLDNNLWFTARLGWRSDTGLVVGVSGSTGRTSPASTNPKGTASSDAAWLDVNQDARLRIVNAFVSWRLKLLRLDIEGLAGEAMQGESVIKTRALHADLIWFTGSSVNALLRYDVMDPRNDRGNDQLTEYSVGLAWRSRYQNSVLTLLGTKRVQQDVPVDEHRALVMWRITPFTDQD